jgi:hypothetical protein
VIVIPSEARDLQLAEIQQTASLGNGLKGKVNGLESGRGNKLVEPASVSIPKTYLFRIDGAKDNDAFFEGMRPSASFVYAGVDFRVGSAMANWIPDLVRVIVSDPPGDCSLTLIELEQTESVALVSCRKYLPENSVAVFDAFNDYLDRVIRQCRSAADPRESEFVNLKATLSNANRRTITTAGALRLSSCFVEELPLIDQDQTTMVAPLREAKLDSREVKKYCFQGVLRLSEREAKALGRCVMVLDAVIRQRDHSIALFHAWRAQDRSQPLKQLLLKSSDGRPALRAIVFETKGRGITLGLDAMLSELVEIWSGGGTPQIDTEHVRALINSYYPAASAIRGHDRMTAVFETARKFLDRSQDADPSVRSG